MRDFFKILDLILKMWTFTRDFFKIVDLILKIVDLYACFFSKSWTSFENRGPLWVTFFQNCGPYFEDGVPLRVISSKFWTSN
jgi:hypothetical protein